MEFVPEQRLSDFSDKDKPWDTHKEENVLVGGFYAEKDAFLQYAYRMNDCAKSLVFGEDVDETKGIKLTKAHFCRVRYCPICSWRKSLALKARFLSNLPAYLPVLQNLAYIHIVFTVMNPPMSELRKTIKLLNSALKKLLKRDKVLPVIKGFIKSIEITLGKDGNPHPHIHFIGAVNKSYFKSRDYIKHNEWVALWRSCLEVDYDPVVNVKKVKERYDRNLNLPEEFKAVAGLIAGMVEVTKYSVKGSETSTNQQFLYGLTVQTKGMRFLEAGGCLKGIFKDPRSKKDDMSEDDLLLKTENSELTKTRLEFIWKEAAYYLHRIFED